MIIRDLFLSDVTRDIPPVVYFHEQTPEKLASEVSEYIITGGWPEDHPNHRRVPDGIHEQYVKLLRAIAAELDKPGGPELPNAWISGFYGSGKSSFAKLLGLSLDGVALPDGDSLAEALLGGTRPRDRKNFGRPGTSSAGRSIRWPSSSTSAASPETTSISTRRPSGRSRSGSATARRSRSSRTSSSSSSATASGSDSRRPPPGCSAVPGPRGRTSSSPRRISRSSLSELYPEKYTDPMSWYASRAGTHARRASRRRTPSPRSATCSGSAGPGATLFLVVDEVSQYVLSNKDRVDRLRAFATALGSTLRGQGLARRPRPAEARRGGGRLVPRLGEGPIPAEAPRAPRRRRTSATSSTGGCSRSGPTRRASSGRCSRSTGADLKLFAYGCDQLTADEFVEVYPMLPGHVDLLMQITTAPPHALGPGAGRRPGHPRAAPAPRRAVPRAEARRHGGRRARDPRPGLRGAAHRARLRRAGEHRADPQPVRERRRPTSPEGGQGVALLELIQDALRPTRSSSRNASTTGSIAGTV